MFSIFLLLESATSDCLFQLTDLQSEIKDCALATTETAKRPKGDCVSGLFYSHSHWDFKNIRRLQKVGAKQGEKEQMIKD